MDIISHLRNFFKPKKTKVTLTSGGFINITKSDMIKNHGDLQVIFHAEGEGCFFAIICPTCGDLAFITEKHTKTFDRDGKLTVDPSILHDKCGAHYYIIKNEILFV